MSDPTSRELPIRPGETALLIIDVQNGTCNETMRETRPWFLEQAETRAVPNIARLVAASRAAGVEVIYTVIESLTADGRDRSLDYKLSGFNFARGSWEAQVLSAITPANDEIVLPKTSSSLFNSTVIDYLLRNLGVRQVLVTGFLTDQCVDHTIRDGADRGYLMVCVEDACATETPERHDGALALFKGYCRRLSTGQVLAELG